jgi:predicted Zn-dependent peptidase
MAFKGTERRTSVQIAEAIEDVGGYINAYTSREMTAYYARVLQGDVPLALDVISDIVLNSIFDPAEIEVERGVILSEIGQALDTPDDIIFDWLQEVSYPGQAIGRSILGPEERVAQFKNRICRNLYGKITAPIKWCWRQLERWIMRKSCAV